MKISVIVPTYNSPRALTLCLRSLGRQSLLPQEVLIADDGSGAETRDAVQKMQLALKQYFPVRHIWHDDIGFRKPKIVNEAVRQSTGDYLVFIDGDCMAHRHFVRAHAENSRPTALLGGRRVELGKDLTEKLMREETILTSFSPQLLYDVMTRPSGRRSRKLEEAIQVRSPLLRKLFKREKNLDQAVYGCNYSLYKSLFTEVNGIDEDFQYSCEDTDLGVRIVNGGNAVRSVVGLAIVFHLWHPFRWTFNNEKYDRDNAILQKRIESREVICRNGMRKL